jgi:integrase
MAADCRRRRLAGLDPIEMRKSERRETQLAEARSMTFEQCRDTFIQAHKVGWRNAKHRAQWINSLTTYVTPVFGSLPIQSVDVALVMKTLEPIWSTKPETAGRVRGRIERILDWAKVRGFRAGENPARWRGHLDVLLPARNKIRQVGHHAALPYSEIGGFMGALRKRQGTAARALEFAILTAARTSEVLGAGWEEINLQGRVWTVPPYRIKAGREHRVPLSREVVALLKQLRGSMEGLVFPGKRRGKPLSNMAMLMVLRRMGRTDLTAHGFRSTFRDWAAECTNFPREVAEAALAHGATWRHVPNAATRSGWTGIDRPRHFLAALSVSSMRPLMWPLASSASGAQACLGRQQDHDGVAERVPRATGEGKQIANIEAGKYLRSFSGHSLRKFVDGQQYTTVTQIEQQRRQFHHVTE